MAKTSQGMSSYAKVFGGRAVRTRWHVENSNTGKWVRTIHIIWRQMHTFGVAQRVHGNVCGRMRPKYEGKPKDGPCMAQHTGCGD